jgi:4-amino-4-deoxy-L-arabinose transferase-like glycosyltransferase
MSIVRLKRIISSEFYVSIALFLLALIPRAISLNVLVTPDEHRWMKRSMDFLTALLNQDWASTFRTGHPGVTTMWLGSASIVVRYFVNLLPMVARDSAASSPDLYRFFYESYLQARLPLLVTMRLPVVLITSLSIVAIYFLSQKLLDNQVIALMGATLLALDPFHLALSRVFHVDAMLASFMTLSVLSLLVYLKGHHRRYLLASGIAAGLAFLTKSPASILIPFAAVMIAGHNFFREKGRQGSYGKQIACSILTLAGWSAAMAIIVVLLWPSMWVDAVGTLRRVIEQVSGYAGSPHERSNFFLGQMRPDPGPLFYPVALLFRLTPLTLVGFVTLTFSSVRGKAQVLKPYIVSLLIYTFLFLAFISAGAKKFDRYLLPIFPTVDILAAVGLQHLAKAIHSRWPSLTLSRTWLLIWMLQAVFTLPQHPYYFSYYNPLVGGASQASRTILVGWGEGLDKAARYLEQKQDAAQLRVITWYPESLAPFFSGEAVDLLETDLSGSWLWPACDYVVFYINQTQRHIPTSEIVQHFRSQRPEHIVYINSIEYAWIYRGSQRPSLAPSIQHPLTTNLADKVMFLGYDRPAPSVESGGKLHLTLYWQCLDQMDEDYNVYIRVLDQAGHMVGQVDSWPFQGVLPTSQWRRGTIFKDRYEVEILAGVPPGDYQLKVGMYSSTTGKRLEIIDQVSGDMGIGLGTIQVVKPPSPPSVKDLSIQYLTDTNLSPQVKLLGFDLPTQTAMPGDALPLTLYWQALTRIEQDYVIIVGFKGEGDQVWDEWKSRPAAGAYPTTRWERGEIVRHWHDITVAAHTPPGKYELTVSLLDSTTGEEAGAVALGSLVVQGQERRFTVPPIQHVVEANLGHRVKLLGYDLSAETLKAGDTLCLTLYWQAQRQMATSYTVFTHLLDKDSHIWGQKDSIPCDGTRPTTGWVEGEVIADEYNIVVQPDAPPGEYVIEVGMYEAETGQRLPVLDEEGQVQGDRVLLGKMVVK